MKGHENTKIATTATQARPGGSVMRVLLPVLLVVYAVLPIAVARHAR
jgi:hypothetical protein